MQHQQLKKNQAIVQATRATEKIIVMGQPTNDIQNAMNYRQEHHQRREQGQAKCPQCKKEYELKPEWKNSGSPTERERWISGVCDDDCWDRFTLPPDHPQHPDNRPPPNSDEDQNEEKKNQ